MSSAILRIDTETHDVLKRLAEQDREPMQSIVAKAIERYRRERFLEEANTDFAELKKRPKEWRAYLAERGDLEGTLKDGLSK